MLMALGTSGQPRWELAPTPPVQWINEVSADLTALVNFVQEKNE